MGDKSFPEDWIYAVEDYFNSESEENDKYSFIIFLK
jgi:hypothetical protein